MRRVKYENNFTYFIWFVNYGSAKSKKCELGHVTLPNLVGDVMSSYLDKNQV